MMTRTCALTLSMILFVSTMAIAGGHSASWYRDVAEYLARKGYSDAAFFFYDQAVAGDPGDPEIYQSRGFYYLSLKKQGKALDDFTKQISVRPEDPAGYMNRGMLLGIIGNDIDAAADFRKACELGSEDGCVMLRETPGATPP